MNTDGKIWVLIISCLVRVGHFDACLALTAHELHGALVLGVRRRGIPGRIWSDNALGFQAAIDLINRWFPSVQLKDKWKIV
jgi:hypothetical protein